MFCALINLNFIPGNWLKYSLLKTIASLYLKLVYWTIMLLGFGILCNSYVSKKIQCNNNYFWIFSLGVLHLWVFKTLA